MKRCEQCGAKLQEKENTCSKCGTKTLDANADEYTKGKQHYSNQEYDQAFECFLSAAKNGNAEAQVDLADCYIILPNF